MKNIVKAIFIFTFTVINFINVNGQIFNPVKWSFNYKHLKNNIYELQFKAKIEDKWHVYGLEFKKNGPIPTSFKFNQNPDYKLIGEVIEPKGITYQDPVFNMVLTYFENRATFTQKVEILSSKAVISGEVEFMSCDDSKCLPPDYVEYSFNIENKKNNKEKETNLSTDENINKGIKNNDVKMVDKNKILQPVTWAFRVNKIDDEIFEFKAIASIRKGWHVYSLDLIEGDGPVNTSFAFDNNDDVEWLGDIEPIGEKINKFSQTFKMELKYYENHVKFYRKFKLLTDVTHIKGKLEFMTCDTFRCLPPEIIEFNTVTKNTDFNVKSNEAKKELEQSYILLLLFSILGGFLALFTPCVFPMVPMTISYFTKHNKSRKEGLKKGVFYGISIVLIYLLLSLPFHIFDSISPDIFNEFSTNPYLNIIFFVIFVIFGISFLGAFDLVLPNSWINKADKASNKSGLLGVFFMALTLILVSFSCTGPGLGILLGSVLSSENGAMALSVGMLGFGLGLGIPFSVFAIFPGWLNTLPKSGGWLNVIKVSFGFLEIAFAFKFLSNADLVLQLGYLHRELFIAIWIGIFLVWTMYMFGLFRLPHDSKIEHLTVKRSLIGTVLLIFVIYLIPGLWGAPLKLISGFPPPMFYSESPEGVGKKTIFNQSNIDNGISQNSGIPIGSDPAHCPHNINCFHDYEAGIAYAKEVQKPVMLDFTGYACVNCRRMEEKVWVDPKILKILKEDIVLISLYVDYKKELPENEKYTSKITGKKIRTVGNKWSEFQIKNYKSNTQPYYVFLDYEENKLQDATAYDPDVDKFFNWLEQGINIFKHNMSKKK